MSEHQLGELSLSAWRAFITTHATLIDLINSELTEAGCIPLHWYDVLIELFEAPEQRLRLHELARKVVLSRSGLTRLVDRLESAGLLQRQPDASDRRGSFAVITEQGIAALRKAWPVYARGISRYFARNLSDEEARLVAEVFNRMLRVAHEADRNHR
ncbi:MAG TPA: MarR family transcriptional regulator [Anaerolineae bacterium]|nr:MarR family transcriptional regulator [Anaerolineae bacterium]